MILEVDTSSPVPPYEQIRAQVADLAATGTLAAGTRLPPIRQLADDLGLAPGTVARAYRELEAAGVLVSRGRHGSFVAEDQPVLASVERRRRVWQAAERFATEVRRLGVDPAVAMEAAQRALSDGSGGSTVQS